MRYKDLPHKIILDIKKHYPEVEDVITEARSKTKTFKGSIQNFQAAALYVLAKRYNDYGYKILEIGTGTGFSACVIAQAAHKAEIITLNPSHLERESAYNSLCGYYPNIEFSELPSWKYFDVNHNFDLIFVDGDHKRVSGDWSYWSLLNEGGLMLFHDYSPAGSWSPCPPVYEFLNDVRDNVLKRDFDVLVQDQFEVGLAGWYK